MDVWCIDFDPDDVGIWLAVVCKPCDMTVEGPPGLAPTECLICGRPAKIIREVVSGMSPWADR